MPKISVIIPTYNSANYLPEAIESVLAQTYKNFEIVVIDDGSTDNTKEVVVPYLDQIVFLETENGDPAKARNHGIRKSSGEYVAFLDADDIWCPDKLERQLAYFSKNPHYHLVFSDAYETGVNNLQKDKLFFSILGRVKPMAGFVFNELLGGNFIYIPSVIVKRDCFEKVGLFDENCELWQGYDLWLRIAFKYQIGFVNAPLFFRRRHEGNRFYNNPLKKILSLIMIMEKWDSDALRLTESDRKTINRQLKTHYARLAAYYLDRGKRADAWPALKKSFGRGFSLNGLACLWLSILPPFAIKYILKAKRKLNL